MARQRRPEKWTVFPGFSNRSEGDPNGKREFPARGACQTSARARATPRRSAGTTFCQHPRSSRRGTVPQGGRFARGCPHFLGGIFSIGIAAIFSTFCASKCPGACDGRGPARHHPFAGYPAKGMISSRESVGEYRTSDATFLFTVSQPWGTQVAPLGNPPCARHLASCASCALACARNVALVSGFGPT
jgi:hypothetical protein